MKMAANEYQVGFGCGAPGPSVWVGYRPRNSISGQEEAIIVQLGEGPHCEEKTLSPREMLQFNYKTVLWREVEGERRFGGIAEDPKWFEKKCKEAGCEWFVPMARRMAVGEHVALEEIQVSYLARNGKPMPCGTWIELFR